MEKAIKRYWPVFVLPTLIAFIIGFVWPFIWGTGLSFCKFTTVKNVQFAGLSSLAHYCCTSLERVKWSWIREKTTTKRKKTTALAWPMPFHWGPERA